MQNLYKNLNNSFDNKNKKINIKKCKNSLNEVEYFLRNINGFWKYIKLYKILK